MQDKIYAFKEHVRMLARNPDFIHRQWFEKWHLEIVERIAAELVEHYPEAQVELLQVMVWLHDYGKPIDFENQYRVTLIEGKKKLLELGFEPDFVQQAVDNIELLDKKMEVDLHTAPIEVQIVSSADGCSHLVGPFMSAWWSENPHRGLNQLMRDTIAKAEKDWTRKIVLPEARKAFESRYKFVMEQGGHLPDKFLN